MLQAARAHTASLKRTAAERWHGQGVILGQGRWQPSGLEESSGAATEDAEGAATAADDSTTEDTMEASESDAIKEFLLVVEKTAPTKPEGQDLAEAKAAAAAAAKDNVQKQSAMCQK